MKTLIISLALLLAGAAQAANSVTLPPRKVTLNGDGSQASLIDLTNELRRAGTPPTKASSRLVQVDLRVKAAPTGAIFALLVNGAAVDSVTVKDDQETTIHLTADSQSTPTPWVLGVRGTADLREIKVTVDSGADIPPAQPNPPKVPDIPANPPKDPEPIGPITNPPEPTNPTNPTKPPERKPEPTQPPVVITPGEPPKDGPVIITPPPSNPPANPPSTVPDVVSVGERVMIVSRTTGRIDYAVVTEITAQGKYNVEFEGSIYRGFSRTQVGVLHGCTGTICVGDRVSDNSRQGLKVSVVARLPGDGIVVEGRHEDYWVLKTSDVTKATPISKKPGTPPPAPVTAPRPFTIGQVILWIDGAGRPRPCSVTQVDPTSVTIVSFDGSFRNRVTRNNNHVAVFQGCAGEVCVGTRSMTTDRNGFVHPVEVIAVQSSELVVVRFGDLPVDVGNWPVEALR